MDHSKMDGAFRARFEAKVKRGDPDECWPWQRYTTKHGYGLLTARAVSKRPIYAHRVAWTLANGPIPDGLHVLHRCDNPRCCNPAHLFLGTQEDNNADRDSKGRVASGDGNGARTKPELNPFVRDGGSGLHGEDHPQARLTTEQVEEIRSLYRSGIRKSELADMFRISQTHAGRIVSGKARVKG